MPSDGTGNGWLLPAHTFHVVVGLIVALSAYLLDQATKHLAVTQLQPVGRIVDFRGPFKWQLVFNEGGAWGFLDEANAGLLFVVATLVVAGFVLWQLPAAHTWRHAAVYGMLLGGALGNASDRLIRARVGDTEGLFAGAVVDFIASNRIPTTASVLPGFQFPTFNVADVWIIVGVGLLFVLWWGDEQEAQERDRVALADIAARRGTT